MGSTSFDSNLALELLKLLPPSLNDRLTNTKNDVDNTILHEVATNNSMTDVATEILNRTPKLLTARNILGETPLFRAVRYGKDEMFKLLAEKLDRMDFETEEDRKACLQRNDGTTILHISVFTENFDLALLIAERYGDLISAWDSNQMTALQHLACNPSAFLSGCEHGHLRRFIYSCIKRACSPCLGMALAYVPFGNSKLNINAFLFSSFDRTKKRFSRITSWNSYQPSVFQVFQTRPGEVGVKILNLMVAKSRFRWPIWEALLEEKHRYEAACELASKLLESDTSWEATNPQAVDRGVPTKPISVQEKGGGSLVSSKEREKVKPSIVLQHPDDKKGKTSPKGNRTRFNNIRNKETPLFLATMSGIPEIVSEILKKYPQAIEHYNDQGRNILHVAINYRQIEIFDMVVEMEMPARRLLRATDTKGNSILHMIGKKGKRYVSRKTRSPAIQLQEELLLFERVKEYSKSHFLKVFNHNNQTADELFASNYCELHEEAKEWLKRTAENCTIVAVLIATVAFAAAYTIPGGPNQSTGIPLLLSQPFFVVFTLADVISLTYALTSVITFLSILTSPFQLQDFKKSLLRKLMLGFTFLILSVSMMMVAFGATVILMIQNKERWTKIVLYSVAFLPVIIFALSYSPLYYRLLKACTGLLNLALELCPRCTCVSPPSWTTKFFNRGESKPNRPQSQTFSSKCPSTFQTIDSSV
ncbi:Ankyrin repeat-containing protein ITN1 [Vitis vinifera]|uniref:Ankyrin repeat-containing protein ITN1 n=1 Tax=Vitis vinifera TaxID=29760 RepID=A0A438EEI4_VITVI|nr:Ankyrin repeat-containing protein ITN1 [Vitis vinifera]